MNKITNERLLLLYLKGFRDETRKRYDGYWALDDKLEISAYNMGCDHADLSVCMRQEVSDEDIVRMIRESGALQEEKTEPI